MTELANIQKGEASFSIKIEDGKVNIVLSYDGKQADAAVNVSLEVDQYLDMLKDAIPGTIDDTLIDLLRAAMKV